MSKGKGQDAKMPVFPRTDKGMEFLNRREEERIWRFVHGLPFIVKGRRRR